MSTVIHSINGKPGLRIAQLVKLLVERQRLQAAYRHQPEPFEAEFAWLACEHPEKCSCAADYPGWTPGGAR